MRTEKSKDRGYTTYRIPNYSSALKNDDKLSALVGVYLSTFSYLEYRCLDLFCMMMRCDRIIAHTILHQFSNFSHRLKVLIDLSVIITLRDEKNKQIEYISRRIDKSNEFRNIVAHSLYAFKINNDDLIFITHVTRKVKPKRIPVLPKDLEDKIEEMEQLMREIDEITDGQFASPVTAEPPTR